MGPFNREQPPAWSPFERPGDHERFVSLVDDTLRSLDVEASRTEAGRTLRLVRPDADDLQVTLDNLAQTCAHADAGDWPTIVRRHLTAVVGPDPLEGIATDAATLRESVRVRLYPTAGLAELDVAPPRREVADGLTEVVVTDTPDTVALLPTARYALLELDDEALFALGRENLRRYEPARLDEVDAGPARLLIAESDNFYTASWALLLDELVDVPSSGALVAVPSRHVLLAHRLADGTAIEAVSLLITTAGRIHDDTPGSLSPSLYWWRDGRLRELAGAADGEPVRFTPPEDFVAVLEGLL